MHSLFSRRDRWLELHSYVCEEGPSKKDENH